MSVLSHENVSAQVLARDAAKIHDEDDVGMNVSSEMRLALKRTLEDILDLPILG